MLRHPCIGNDVSLITSDDLVAPPSRRRLVNHVRRDDLGLVARTVTGLSLFGGEKNLKDFCTSVTETNAEAIFSAKTSSERSRKRRSGWDNPAATQKQRRATAATGSTSTSPSSSSPANTGREPQVAVNGLTDAQVSRKARGLFWVNISSGLGYRVRASG